MRASLRTLSLSFVIVVAMGLGTYSHAQEAAVEKAAVQAEAAPPAVPYAPPAGMKLVPEDFIADFNLSLYSQYIWRGFELSRDSFVMFPQLTIGYKGFAVTTWVDLDTRYVGSPDKEFKLQETDVIATYSNSYKPWKLNYTLGWILYDYQPSQHVDAEAAGPMHIRDTKNQELFLTLGLDTLLKPTFSVYDEIEVGQAWYFTLGVSHSFAVYKDWSLDLAGMVSYLHDRSHDKSDPAHFGNFHDGNISAGLKIPLTSVMSIKPNIQYSFPLSSDAANQIQDSSFSGHHNNFVYGGLILDVAI
jgi:hypothetical protein